MSRIGNKVIVLPAGVELTNNDNVSCKGPKENTREFSKMSNPCGRYQSNQPSNDSSNYPRNFTHCRAFEQHGCWCFRRVQKRT